MNELIKVEYDDEYYCLRKDKWYNITTFMEPSKQIQIALNRLIVKQLEQEDLTKLTRQELYKLAQQARDIENPKLSAKYLKELLYRNPMDGAALAIYSSLLRKSGYPKHAIRITNEYVKKKRDPVVLTTRAAAFCDLEQWDKAKCIAKQAYAIAPSEEVLGVFRRIKARKR